MDGRRQIGAGEVQFMFQIGNTLPIIIGGRGANFLRLRVPTFNRPPAVTTWGVFAVILANAARILVRNAGVAIANTVPRQHQWHRFDVVK